MPTPRMRSLRADAVILFCALLATSLQAGSQPPARPTTTPSGPASVGREAPDFTLPGVDGRTHSLADYRGRPVTLFFFCGCDPCHRCARAWGEVQRDAPAPTPQAVPGKRAAVPRPGPVTLVVFLGDAAPARQFAAATGLDPARTVLLTDPETRVASAYDALPCPRVFTLDARGALRYTNAHKDDAPPDAPAATIVSRAWAALQGSLSGAPEPPAGPPNDSSEARESEDTMSRHLPWSCLGVLAWAAPWAGVAADAPPTAPAPTAPAVPAAPAPLTMIAGPNVAVEGPTTAHREFGPVDPLVTPRLEARFTVRNGSGSPVTISRLQPSCGCTSALLGQDASQTSRRLAPGEQADIQVSVDLAHLQGAIYKTIRVYTQEAAAPVATLVVTAQLQNVLSFEPSVLEFGRVAAGAPHVLTLRATLDPRFLAGASTRLISSTPDVTVSPPDAGPPTGAGQPVVQTYTVTLSPHAHVGALFGSLTFAAPSAGAALAPRLATASVPLVGVVVGEVSASPGSVLFGVVPAGEKATRQVVLSGTTAAALHNARLSCASPWLSARLRSVTGGGAPTSLLEVTLSARTPPGGLNTQVTVTSGHGQTLVVPVLAQVTGASAG